MSESNPNSEATQPETPPVEVSAETKALVETKMPDESDEIKHHTMALIEAIKKQAQSSLESAGEIGRENYVNTMRQTQTTLKNTGLLFDEQWESLEKTIAGLEDTATKNWEFLLNDMKKWGDRLDRAVNEAWKILTEPEESEEDSPPDSDSESKS
ncbi:hypothetical protein [Spirulina sp. 06S082]|uniref:hypothetical protein n=1 Tax=Spirulina sp. 06S082 TaxID=3110248 RepID=UPI002B21A4FE|nr:hypothetical protein [Spirulina sp. 06S082]MEA5471863.1 hypothetical protein [Spirulina sp. 06S082]